MNEHKNNRALAKSDPAFAMRMAILCVEDTDDDQVAQLLMELTQQGSIKDDLPELSNLIARERPLLYAKLRATALQGEAITG